MSSEPITGEWITQRIHPYNTSATHFCAGAAVEACYDEVARVLEEDGVDAASVRRFRVIVQPYDDGDWEVYLYAPLGMLFARYKRERFDVALCRTGLPDLELGRYQVTIETETFAEGEEVPA